LLQIVIGGHPSGRRHQRILSQMVLLLTGSMIRGALLAMREILRGMQRGVVKGAPATLAVEKVRKAEFVRSFHLFNY
jgi:hypothetical protein